jgi:hypothetical protein
MATSQTTEANASRSAALSVTDRVASERYEISFRSGSAARSASMQIKEKLQSDVKAAN